MYSCFFGRNAQSYKKRHSYPSVNRSLNTVLAAISFSFTAILSAQAGSATRNHRTLTVSPGDTVDFLVNFGHNGSYFNDSTGIQFKLTQQ